MSSQGLLDGVSPTRGARCRDRAGRRPCWAVFVAALVVCALSLGTLRPHYRAAHNPEPLGRWWDIALPCLSDALRGFAPEGGVTNPGGEICWGAKRAVYQLQDDQLAVMERLRARYPGGAIPWQAVLGEEDGALLRNEVDAAVVAHTGGSARWTIDNAPARDGFHHVLVGQMPCAAHGCCGLPWVLRANSTDMRSLYNHFINNEYGLVQDLQGWSPEYILDAGGVGMAPVFFSLVYPHAKILRVEPHPDNFNAGARNAIDFPNIKQVNLGLWDRHTRLQMCDNVDIDWGEDWPFQGSQQQAWYSREPQDPPCKVVAVDDINVAPLDSIMETFNVPRFDFIKMDIEGAELRVFRNTAMRRILRATKFFVAELHSWVVPGSAEIVRRVFYELGGFKHMTFDENEVWLRNEMLQC